MAALQQAFMHRQPNAGLIHHSDRGSQYSSKDFKDLLVKYCIVASMSGSGNCYDNAAMESFFHTGSVAI
jgi:transposase InsO family protein